jgi:hypothetical protein
MRENTSAEPVTGLPLADRRRQPVRKRVGRPLRGREQHPSGSTMRPFALLVLALAVVPLVLAGRDYYEVLGIEKSANDKEIKRVSFSCLPGPLTHIGPPPR